MKLIYDGNNLAHRCNNVYNLYTKQGERTSVIYGTFNSLKKDITDLKKMAKQNIEEVYFVWDAGRSKKRMELYPEYKASRRTESDPVWYEEFKSQVEFLHKNLKYLGIKSIRFSGWEADDIIYALCRELKGDLVIVSNDEDLYQLICGNVTVFSPIKRKLINNINFKEQVGIPLSGFLSYKVIKGDTSDNIKGIDGIGEKTSKNLVNKYGNVGNMLRFRDDLRKSKRTSAILDPKNLQIIERNNQLMNLGLVDYKEILRDLKKVIKSKPKVDEKQVISILKSKQFVSILVEYIRWISVFKELNA